MTIVTQVGGVVYLVYKLLWAGIRKNGLLQGQKVGVKVALFLVLYGLVCFGVVPKIAKIYGRVPLPLFEIHHLRPLNSLTYLLNRNYVRVNLREAVFKAADKMNDQFPMSTVHYLDANFPFFNRFPLLPHLSHHDGKKLDLSFFYIDAKTKKSSNRCPSFIGYGVCEEPLPGEINTAQNCSKRGYWQYNLLKKLVPQGAKQRFVFDAKRTRTLIQIFAANPIIGKIFLEPHLKTRLGLNTSKIRFHGCQAVRHDDHVHIQLK